MGVLRAYIDIVKLETHLEGTREPFFNISIDLHLLLKHQAPFLCKIACMYKVIYIVQGVHAGYRVILSTWFFTGYFYQEPLIRNGYFLPDTNIPLTLRP